MGSEDPEIDSGVDYFELSEFDSAVTMVCVGFMSSCIIFHTG